MKLVITPEVRKLGINVLMAVFNEVAVSNKSRPLEKLKKELIEELQAQPDEKDAITDGILEGYRELYRLTAAGELVPPAQHLRRLAVDNGRLPNINTVVDAYNLVSARTGLSIGAHDAAHIAGDVIFKLLDGSELYTPLGLDEAVRLAPGEYACADYEKILCRLDVKQCQQTRITKASTAFIIYVQGNRLS